MIKSMNFEQQSDPIKKISVPCNWHYVNFCALKYFVNCSYTLPLSHNMKKKIEIIPFSTFMNIATKISGNSYPFLPQLSKWSGAGSIHEVTSSNDCRKVKILIYFHTFTSQAPKPSSMKI